MLSQLGKSKKKYIVSVSRLFLIAMLVISTVSCLKKKPKPGDEAFAVTYPKKPDLAKYASNGAIYNNQTALPLFETPRARHVGDLLTVVLIEQTDGQKIMQNNFNKQNETTITNPTLFGRPVSANSLGEGYNLGFDIDATGDHQSNATTIQNSRLTGNVSVTVSEVLPNGYMKVKGEKWVHINAGDEYIRLSGVVRPQDITPDNTITSDKVANARIEYGGVGQAHDAQKMNWISRFIWGSIFPL